jgi:ADP-ribose pyrophosphatase YjhB (NUDIX family)
MISFDINNNRFQCRVVGIAFRGDNVLLHQAKGDNFWAFPGGRAEFGESAEQTLKREMIEEIAADIEIVRLLWFVENFFTYDNRNYHEIALYFLMRIPFSHKYMTGEGPFRGEEEQPEAIFKWVPNSPEVLSGLPLLPRFLITSLQQLPESMQHIIER